MDETSEGAALNTSRMSAAAPERLPAGLIPHAKCSADRQTRAIVKHLIAAGDVALLIAHPGAGKSAIAPLIAFRVAEGRPVFGRRTAACPVIYAAAEDADGMQARLEAIRAEHGAAERLHLWRHPFDVRDAKKRRALAQAARDIGARLVIVDTLQAAAPGMDARQDDAMAPAVTGLRALAKEAGGAAVVALHHPTKAGGYLPRGSGLLWQDADALLAVEGEGAATRRIAVIKNRRGPCGDLGGFAVVTRELGTDAEGDAIIAPLAVETAAPERGADTNQRAPARALEELRRLAAEAGGAAIPIHNWRKACAAIPLSRGRGDAGDRAFRRAKDSLMKQGAVAERDGGFAPVLR